MKQHDICSEKRPVLKHTGWLRLRGVAHGVSIYQANTEHFLSDTFLALIAMRVPLYVMLSYLAPKQ